MLLDALFHCREGSAGPPLKNVMMIVKNPIKMLETQQMSAMSMPALQAHRLVWESVVQAAAHCYHTDDTKMLIPPNACTAFRHRLIGNGRQGAPKGAPMIEKHTYSPSKVMNTEEDTRGFIRAT
jgi:hypothetical protein